MSEFKEFELKFDEWWEENYMNVSADRTEAFDIYSLGLKHQQAKVEELQKRVDAAINIVAQLSKLEDEKWSEWEGMAELFAQGEASAYGHASRILEQALKGENNE